MFTRYELEHEVLLRCSRCGDENPELMHIRKWDQGGFFYTEFRYKCSGCYEDQYGIDRPDTYCSASSARYHWNIGNIEYSDYVELQYGGTK